MKLLNEANLVYFSTCGSHSTKEGWLYKKGEVNKSFQKRWFVLKGNLLFYFDKSGDKEPNGVIILEGFTVELCDISMDGHTFQIGFKGASNSRRYVLQAESHPVMEAWMKAITCAGYDYMRLLVAELKSQLDELNAHELSAELAGCKTKDVSDKPARPTVPPNHELMSLAFEQSSVTADYKSAARLNPFDRLAEDGDSDSAVDPFGQVSFEKEGVVGPTCSGSV